ncbi:MAG: glucose-1-phosphate thymidylyltransferase [Dehalococcoidia bacterium]
MASQRPLKGLVVSGGKGSRLRPFTYTGAKQLVPIANKPVLFYGVEQLVAAGITDIGVVVGDTGAQVEEALGDGGRFGARFTYLHQEQPLGIAHTLVVARDFLGDSPFVMFLGDNFLRGGIQGLVERFTTEAPAAQVQLVRVPRPQEFGVAVLSPDGRLERLVEKPADPPSDLVIIGLYMFQPVVHEVVATLRPSARGELEITEAIQGLIDRSVRVDACPVEDHWIDTGRMGDILAANRLVLEILEPAVHGDVDGASRVDGRVVIEPGAQVRNSVIEGPAIIGAETVLEHAYVGPFTSIYHHCYVRDAELAGSVVLERTRIEAVSQRIEGSLIGRDVRLTGATRRPRGYRLMLGDHSEAELP